MINLIRPRFVLEWIGLMRFGIYRQAKPEGVIFIYVHLTVAVIIVTEPPPVTQVTTARKAVTLLLSYLIFTKPLTEQHGTGLLLIGMGIVLKLLPDNKLPNRPNTTTIKTTTQRGITNQEEKRPLVWFYTCCNLKKQKMKRNSCFLVCTSPSLSLSQNVLVCLFVFLLLFGFDEKW